jgi:hypothetical protein
MTLRFDLLMETLSSCIFLSQLFSCLTKISSVFFFFNFYFVFELLDYVFHLFYPAGVAFQCVFVWLNWLFISRISVWFFYLRSSISLFNFSFIFCVVIFNSYISLFWFPLSHIGVVEVLWSHLFISVSSHVHYFWCLEMSWVHLLHSG